MPNVTINLTKKEAIALVSFLREQTDPVTWNIEDKNLLRAVRGVVDEIEGAFELEPRLEYE